LSDIIREIEREQLKESITPFKVGDTVRVHIRIIEGAKERIQIFEGVVMKRQNGGSRETFTVRRVAYGVGVEKTWPVHSPRVERIEVVRRGVVRRAKLFYLRQRVGKASKVKEEIMKKAYAISFINITSSLRGLTGNPVPIRNETVTVIGSLSHIH
jgi:large subunit ribosomal protein L19